MTSIPIEELGYTVRPGPHELWENALMDQNSALHGQKTLFGHPTGLFTLFFAEMWERFSFYGMRALLFLYMTKGFLGFGDRDANAVYGAYTALIYMTPFFGGMIADRLIGARTSVVIGGLLMSAGHLLMTIETDLWFFTALGLLIAGNGFFKPNISSMVGTLYPPGSPKRDGGFTLFYIGINLGAATAPLLCGYIGETQGWHRGFGLATIGMLLGTAIFVAPTILTQGMILLTAAATAYGLIFYRATGSVFGRHQRFRSCGACHFGGDSGNRFGSWRFTQMGKPGSQPQDLPSKRHHGRRWNGRHDSSASRARFWIFDCSRV